VLDRGYADFRELIFHALQRISVWLTYTHDSYIRFRRRGFTQPLIHTWLVWVNVTAIRCRVNRAYSAVRYPARFRSAQVRMGGLPLPASWTLTCLGSPENSFSTVVSRSVVVLEP
jgi:hypothetical protein